MQTTAERMDYIAQFENNLHAAKNAQSIARIIDDAFKPKFHDSKMLDVSGDLELTFSYQECLVNSSTDNIKAESIVGVQSGPVFGVQAKPTESYAGALFINPK